VKVPTQVSVRCEGDRWRISVAVTQSDRCNTGNSDVAYVARQLACRLFS
jgi:hypothetical protein